MTTDAVISVPSANTATTTASCSTVFRARPASSQLLLWLVHHRASSTTRWLQSGLLRSVYCPQNLHGGVADLCIFLDQHGTVLAIVQRVGPVCSRTLRAAQQTSALHSCARPAHDTAHDITANNHVSQSSCGSTSLQMPPPSCLTGGSFITTMIQPHNRLAQHATFQGPIYVAQRPLQIWQIKSASAMQQSAAPLPLLTTPWTSLERPSGLITSRHDAADSAVGLQPEAAAGQQIAAGQQTAADHQIASGSPLLHFSIESASMGTTAPVKACHDSSASQQHRYPSRALRPRGSSVGAVSSKPTTSTRPVNGRSHWSGPSKTGSPSAGAPLISRCFRRSRPFVARAVCCHRRQQPHQLALQGRPAAKCTLSQHKRLTLSIMLTGAKGRRGHQCQGPSAPGPSAQRQQVSASQHAAATDNQSHTQPSWQAAVAQRRPERLAVRLARLLQAQAASMGNDDQGQQQAQQHPVAAVAHDEQQMQNCLSQLPAGEVCRVHQSWAIDPRPPAGNLRMLAHMLQWQRRWAGTAALNQPGTHQLVINQPAAATLTAPPMQLGAAVQPSSADQESACSSRQQAARGQRKQRLRGATDGHRAQPKAASGERPIHEQQLEAQDTILTDAAQTSGPSPPVQHSREEPLPKR